MKSISVTVTKLHICFDSTMIMLLSWQGLVILFTYSGPRAHQVSVLLALVKWSGHEADYIHPRITEVKNKWRCTYIPPCKNLPGNCVLPLDLCYTHCSPEWRRNTVKLMPVTEVW